MAAYRGVADRENESARRERRPPYFVIQCPRVVARLMRRTAGEAIPIRQRRQEEITWDF